MMDMSIFETLEDGQEKRGWLMTEIQVLLFGYVICDNLVCVICDNLVDRHQLPFWGVVSSSNIQWLDSMLR